jgi:GAF domain-containing protein
MSAPEMPFPLHSGDPLPLLELAAKVLAAESLEDLPDSLLPFLGRILSIPAALLYLQDARLPTHYFFHAGLQLAFIPSLERICQEQFASLSHQSQPHTISLSLPHPTASSVTLYPLRTPKSCFGLLGLTVPVSLPPAAAKQVESLLPLLTHGLGNLIARVDMDKRLAHLNTYLNVSSMIAQALDLKDVLEAVLFFCMDALAAEAASVLLLDYEKTHFRFYSAEGEAKEVLLMATFPADQGLAGSVLETQQAEIVNDVQHDPRFYGKFDSQSGFHTRNMIVLPLTAGEEKIGVLEVLNKRGGKPFLEEELLLLQSIAEEIAFAIRNGKLFEVVVKSYCKQRQGETSCKGCKRPLGSWTPCAKYREASIEI